MKKILSIFLVVGLLAIIGCGNRSGGKPDPTNPNNQTKQEKPLPVIVKEVQPGTLNQYTRVTGKLEGITDITVSSEVNGKVVEIFKKLGDWVKKGEEIGRIDNSYYKIKLETAKANVLSAEASFEAASVQMTAAENLYGEGRISQSEYANIRSTFKRSQAGLDDAKANLELARLGYDNSRFIAPVSGYITFIPIEVGEMVSTGKPICSIVNSKRLIIKTGISESSITRVKVNQKVTIKHTGFKETFPGVITGIGIKPINGSANYPIEIELANPDGKLYPGMVIEAEILSKVFKDVIYTSINNIKEEYDQYFAYIILDDNTAKKVPVTLGEKIDQNVIITKGLEPGQKLVIEGFDNLSPGKKVEIRKGLE
ncbi:efflux RND transporter periplasmic adaptor subunit [Candidatus Dependentiae bacterium]|nr:efflux RND transporter periplasmic adaptor subunit [Candidatus Dependentiae bacterium]